MYTHELTKIMQCCDMVGILPQYKSVHLLRFILLLQTHVTVSQQLHSIQVIWVQFCQSGEEFHCFCVPVMMKLVFIIYLQGRIKMYAMKIASEMTVRMLCIQSLYVTCLL